MSPGTPLHCLETAHKRDMPAPQVATIYRSSRIATHTSLIASVTAFHDGNYEMMRLNFRPSLNSTHGLTAEWRMKPTFAYPITCCYLPWPGRQNWSPCTVHDAKRTFALAEVGPVMLLALDATLFNEGTRW